MTALPPGSWLPADDPQIPHDVPHGCAVWVEDGRIVIEEDPTVSGDEDEDEMPKVRNPRPIGLRMADALEYIRTHPGVCKADVYRGANVGRSRDGTDPIDRLLWRKLIYDLGPSHRYELYAWQEPEPEPDGYWRPGHP